MGGRPAAAKRQARRQTRAGGGRGHAAGACGRASGGRGQRRERGCRQSAEAAAEEKCFREIGLSHILK